MTSFNYYLLCSSHEFQEGKNVAIDKHSDDSNCLLTPKEKKEFWFLCIKCCIINSISFDIAANKETIQLLKTGKKLKEENMNLAKELTGLEQKYKQSLQKLKNLNYNNLYTAFYIKENYIFCNYINQ